MSADFLVNFLQVAKTITGVERGMAVDQNLNVLHRINLDEETLKTPRFSVLANSTLRRAMESNDAILTNNVVTNPSEAPLTNTSFSDLRVIVAIPLGKAGAVYLDQHIRQGVISREMIEDLHNLGKQALDQGAASSTEELLQMYQALP
jgi:hypothetical protein